MQLTYPNKKSELEILTQTPESEWVKFNDKTSPNQLIFWENTVVLKNLIEKQGLVGKIDLVYIVPPFATNNIFTLKLVYELVHCEKSNNGVTIIGRTHPKLTYYLSSCKSID